MTVGTCLLQTNAHFGTRDEADPNFGQRSGSPLYLRGPIFRRSPFHSLPHSPSIHFDLYYGLKTEHAKLPQAGDTFDDHLGIVGSVTFCAVRSTEQIHFHSITQSSQNLTTKCRSLERADVGISGSPSHPAPDCGGRGRHRWNQ